jgi:hypothetical protein
MVRDTHMQGSQRYPVSINLRIKRPESSASPVDIDDQLKLVEHLRFELVRHNGEQYREKYICNVSRGQRSVCIYILNRFSKTEI